ncbi:MAG: 3,5-nucleoside bisphosphate phosphatase, partial [Acidobacteriota bacterium]|nr:3,5-nucleoside bisphosphate phosphatase [Acidobacteriota bacterium]
MFNDSEYAAGNVDLHIHTIVSDAVITPAQILDCAKELNLKKISITDHDAVGAYFYFEYDLSVKAKELGITIIPGIELDSYFGDVEIHVLGYDINVKNRELNDYLTNIHSLRKLRIQEQLEKINQFYKKEVIKKDEIFIPHRDTLMKPHLVHALLERGLFSEYREA